MMSGGERTASDAERRRVAVEMVAKHERTLRRTARRYSICAADAEDAFQRALEILLTKAPPGEARELVRWMQTVTKHEALAVRRGRERNVSPAMPPLEQGEETADLLSLLPSHGPGPAERAERREAIARSREALKTLKPAELRALTLLAQGYSYAEIGEITGFSRTKINRCLAEGRERFRSFLSRSESGERCVELRPVLSAFCDGEAGPAEAASLREHLRVCAHCRAALRAYRAAPGAAAALLPVPLLRGLLERANEALGSLHARLGGRGTLADSSARLAATGGARGGPAAALAKAVAICACTVGGATACVTAGVIEPPLSGLAPDRTVAASVEHVALVPAESGGRMHAAPVRSASRPRPKPATGEAPTRSVAEAPPGAAVETGIEYESPPPPPEAEAEPAPPAPEVDSPPSAGSAAGEFGP